jgi:folylpolyglutamate synthase
MDHLAQLGPTIERIAWRKARILKPGTLAFSAPQDEAVTLVLRSRAAEKGVPLRFVEENSSLPEDATVLQTSVQRLNCSLALAIVDGFLGEKGSRDCAKLDMHDIDTGVEKFNWPGRFEIIVEKRNKWVFGWSTQHQRGC